jgi:malate dehydrogenase
MGGVLDTARMRTFIAMESGAHPKDVNAIVLGGHGDLMVPVSSLTKIGGKCITDVLSDEKITQIVDRTKNGGAEIVGLLKTGSAYYAPAASTVEMIECILGVKSETLPCSVHLDGEYGISGVYLGVPVKLGPKGIEEIVDVELTEDEKQGLERSAVAVRGLIEAIGN